MDWGNVISDALRALVGSEAIVYGLAAIGLNVHFGYTGLLNFGQAGFMAVAAYGMATIVTTFGLPFWLGILVGFAGVVAKAVTTDAPAKPSAVAPAKRSAPAPSTPSPKRAR